MHLFLSPHLDDAVLSCGGTIGRLTRSGEAVLVLTVFAGDPAPPYSRLARRLHRQWGDPPQPVRLRRAEDAAANARLGAVPSYEDLPDSIYRRDRQGAWMYTGNASLMGALPHPDDEWIPHYLAARVEATRRPEDGQVYAPLGVGGHVDHMLTFRAAQILIERGYTVSFYEDFPYVFRKARYRQRLAEMEGWTPTVVAFDEQLLLAKVDAFSYYRSQILALFQRTDGLDLPFREWATAVSNSHTSAGERYWHPPGAGRSGRKTTRTAAP